jgi:hypothetical protein
MQQFIQNDVIYIAQIEIKLNIPVSSPLKQKVYKNKDRQEDAEQGE